MESARSKTAFISRLPLEILNCIIAEVTCDSSSSGHAATWSIVQMQLVCRLWKEVIISSPSLWSNINTSLRIVPDRFVALLKLSGPVPLDVVFTSGTAPGRPIWFTRIATLLELLNAQSLRLRSLKIVHSLGAMSFMMECPFFKEPLPLPCLEALTLDVSGPDAFSQGLRCIFELPELFQSASTATSLKRLHLRAAVPWPNNCFPNLTHLCISNVDPGSSQRPMAFLEFMRSSPNLVHLTLDTFGPIASPPDGTTVFMPNLREVYIRNCMWTTVVIGVLGHLVLPATANVEVRCINYGMGHNVIKSLLGPRAAYLRNTGAPRKLALALHRHTISVSFSGPSGSMEIKLNAQTQPRILREFRHRWLTTALCTLPMSLDLRDVEDFSLSMSSANVPSRVMREFLLKMPKVRSCTVWLDPKIGRKYWTRCLSSRNVTPAPFSRLQRLQLIGNLAESWVPTAAQIASLVLRRSQSNCDRLVELVCSTLVGVTPESVTIGGNVNALMIGRCHVTDFVDSVKLQSVHQISLLRAVNMKTWDDSETHW